MKTLVMAANLGSGQYMESLSSVEALKCIANSLLLVSATKDYFEENNALPACNGILLRSDVSGMSRFLAVRILFFVTIDRPSIVASLVDNHDIASGLAQVSFSEFSQEIRYPINLTRTIIVIYRL